MFQKIFQRLFLSSAERRYNAAYVSAKQQVAGFPALAAAVSEAPTFFSVDAYAALAEARAAEVESFTSDGLDVQAYAEFLKQRDRDMQDVFRNLDCD
jgi:hypothetical protein